MRQNHAIIRLPPTAVGKGRRNDELEGGKFVLPGRFVFACLSRGGPERGLVCVVLARGKFSEGDIAATTHPPQPPFESRRQLSWRLPPTPPPAPRGSGRPRLGDWLGFLGKGVPPAREGEAMPWRGHFGLWGTC
eukprot:9474768-Pyramimonas_sp.AAC.1